MKNINFNKPVLYMKENEFKVYCKKSSMKEIFQALKGDLDYN